MFSQLGPLFRVHLRHTEANDTRQNIPHEERKNYTERNKENHKQNEKDEKWTDDTIVSVMALKSFLINFLKTLPDSENSGFLKNHEAEAFIKPSRPPQKIRPSNTHNAKAVRAYQTMATHSTTQTSNNKSKSPSDDVPTHTSSSSQNIESEELREIHLLITDLDFLQNNNVTQLNILKSNSFVEGVKEAINVAKSKI